MQPRGKNKTAQFALRISLIYGLAGGVWILFSSSAVADFISDPGTRARLEIYKGWAFVGVTALFLYAQLRGHLRRWEREAAERRRTEEALCDSTAHYHSLVEQIPAGLFRKDAEGRYVFVNSWFCRLKGAKAEWFLGKTPQEVAAVELAAAGVSPSQIHQLATQGRDHHQQIMQTGRQIEVEEHGLGPDGKAQQLQVIKSPVYDSNGKIIGSQGILFEITERKRAEQALHQSEERLREVLRSARCILNFGEVGAPADWRERVMKEPRLFHWNFPVLNVEAAQEVFPLEATPDKSYQDIWAESRHPDDFHQMHLVARDAFLHDRPFYRNVFRCTDKHGVEHWMQEFVTLHKLGENRWQVFGINTDITDLKKTEGALRFSQEKLREVNRSLQTLSKCNEALVRATDEMSLLTKICEIITGVGGFRLAWVGYMEQDEAKSIRPVAWAGPETSYLKNLRVTWADGEHSQGPCGTAIRTGQPAVFLNLAAHPDFEPGRKAASRHGFASSIGLPLKADGKMLGALVVYSSQAAAFSHTETALLVELANDLAFGIGTLRARTQRRQLEEQLRQSQKMEAVGRLAGGVAHDFNNILTIIQGNASLLSNPQLDLKEKASCSHQIVQASERAAGLTRQLLIFSRKQVMRPASVDLNEVVGNMTKMLRRILGEDISLQTHYAPDLALIHADPGMVEQVLMNLIINARDAMPAGGQLGIATSAREFTPAPVEKNPDAQAGPHVCLTVRDTGCGIPKENLPRIFEPFFTTKAVDKGTGLGLATVYSIVQQHRGWITVTSEVNEGTAFDIYFPAMKSKRTEKEALPATAQLPRGSGTVLVVEDELAVRVLVSNLLERCGYAVLQADTAISALAIWREHKDKIQLLLTDIIMPDGLNGYDLARQLQAAKPELKIVYTSGYRGEVAGKSPALTDGVNFLQKPYPPQKLLQILQDKLNHN